MTSAVTTAGLSTAEIEEIRGSLAAGRKPKVMFTSHAGQIAGEIGQVVRLTDPQESDEWLVVRFGRDELPFSPADLTIPPRGRSNRKGTAPAAASVPAPTSPEHPEHPERPTPAPTPAAAERPAGPATPAGSAAAPTPAAAGAARSAGKRAARGSRPKSPAALTVTLSYEAGEWTVGATQGNKVLAKPYLIRPSEALKMVGMLDVPGVHEAVEQIINAEVAEAQLRAEALRHELAEVEARLAELRGEG